MATLSELRLQVTEARNKGNLKKAERLAEDYLVASQSFNSTRDIAKAHFQIARNAMERNLYPLAQTHLNKAITGFSSIGELIELGRAYRQLGLTYRYQANYPTALEYIYQALQVAQQEENIEDTGAAYNSIGVVLDKMGLYEEAIQAHQNSMDINYQLGDNAGIASALYNLGAIRMSMGDYDEALSYHHDALAIDIAEGNPKDIAYSHNKIGYLLTIKGDFLGAREHLEKSLNLFKQIETPRDTDWTLSALAKLELEEGNLDKANDVITGVIQRSLDNDYKSLLVDAYQIAAEVAFKQRRYTKTLEFIDAGLKQAIVINERDQESFFQELKVKVHVANDSLKDAFEALQRQKSIDDELFKAKRTDSIAKVQAQTEFVRRAHQIDLLKQEQALQQAKVDQQRLNRNILLISLLAAVVVVFLAYNRFMQKRLNKHLSQQVKLRTQELEAKHKELQSAYEEIEAISLTDKLTGLRNRRFLESHIDKDVEQCLRIYQNWWQGKTQQPVQEDIVFFVIDLDNFKQVNDQYGHQAGDNVLVQFTERMTSVFRHADYLVRWGGEEFVAIARNIDREDASSLAKRMQQVVNQTPFDLVDGKSATQSCSIGYACYPPTVKNEAPIEAIIDKRTHKNVDWQAFIALADACLYQVKSSGKNSWLGVETVKSANAFSKPITHQRLKELIDKELLDVAHP